MYWLKNAGQIDGIEALGGMDPSLAPYLETQNSWSLMLGQDIVLACGGTMEQWKGRHVAWFIPAANAGKYMRRITKMVPLLLADVSGRIEATVREDFTSGHRWAKLLGFEVENPPGVLKQFGPDGADHIAYVRFA